MLIGGLWVAVALGAPGMDATEQAEAALRDAAARGRIAPLGAPASEPEPLIRLGQRLFADPELSGNRDITCLHCHHPRVASGDGLPLAIGTGGRGAGPGRQQRTAALTRRNSQPLFNLGFDPQAPLFWDGRVRFSALSHSFSTPEPALNGYFPLQPERRHPIARALDSSLAAQALFPVASHEEMRGAPGTNELADAPDNLEVWRRLMDRLGRSGRYRAWFAEAYPHVGRFEELNFGHAASAIAAFERRFFAAVDTPFDRYLRGEADALTDRQKRGAALFVGRGRCSECHAGPNLTSFGYFNIAVPSVRPAGTPEDLGRAEVPGLDRWTRERYRFAFRAPPLRNVALTAPYMHNGAFATLREVLRHYSNPAASLAGGPDTPTPPRGYRFPLVRDRSQDAERLQRLDERLRAPLDLTPAETEELLDFLKNGLTDPAWVP